MPIVANGNARITLFAGIKNNGISSTRLPYAVYNSKTYDLDIEPGKTYTLSPEFEYNSKQSYNQTLNHVLLAMIINKVTGEDQSIFTVDDVGEISP